MLQMKSILFGDDLIRQQKKFRGFNAFITIYINKKKKNPKNMRWKDRA